MLNTEQNRPGADEQYIMATNASDLTVDSNKVTAVDFLIEAGLVANRMGAILIHLAGEWAAADKPPKLGDADIVALAELLPRLNAKGKLDMKKARAIGIAGRARGMPEQSLEVRKRPTPVARAHVLPAIYPDTAPGLGRQLNEEIMSITPVTSEGPWPRTLTVS